MGRKVKNFLFQKKHNANKANIVHIYSAHWYMMNGALAFAATTIPPPHNANQANIVHYTQRTGIWKQAAADRRTIRVFAWCHCGIAFYYHTCACVFGWERHARAFIRLPRCLPPPPHTMPYTFVSVCVARQPASRLHEHTFTHTSIIILAALCMSVVVRVLYGGCIMMWANWTINYKSHM